MHHHYKPTMPFSSLVAGCHCETETNATLITYNNAFWKLSLLFEKNAFCRMNNYRLTTAEFCVFTKSSFAIQPASPKWHGNFSRAHHLLGLFDHSKPVTISVATIITMITITITTTTMTKIIIILIMMMMMIIIIIIIIIINVLLLLLMMMMIIIIINVLLLMMMMIMMIIIINILITLKNENGYNFLNKMICVFKTKAIRLKRKQVAI